MMREHITSRHNSIVTEAIKLLSDTKYRREERIIAAEGTKLLADALESEAEIKLVIASESLESNLPPISSGRIIIVPDKLFSTISTQKNPQGVLFFCTRPNYGGRLWKGRFAVLDGLQDPGNVGTVIRTAAAFGIDGVIVCGAGADPFSPKVVRASMGAIFKIPVLIMTSAELQLECNNAGIPLLAAIPSGNAADVRYIQSDAAAIVIGNEGSGVSDEIKRICNGTVTIPMAKGTESLNAAVAAAVIIWETMRGIL